jgi:hypothetical protein
MPFYIDNRWDGSADARYFLGWIDELIAITKTDAKRFRTAEQRDEVLAVYQKARDIYAARTAGEPKH